MSTFRRVAKCMFFLPLLLIFTADGCSDHNSSTTVDAFNAQESDRLRNELLTYAIESLHQLPRFQTQETFLHILRQINQRQNISETENQSDLPDRLTAAWPETEMLTQLVNRLNQWVRLQPKPAAWKPDSLINSLPKSLKDLALVKTLDKMDFPRFEAYYLLENTCLHDVAHWARGDVLDDLSRAKNLFEWVICNIQIAPDSKNRVPLFPWESLFFGRGTAMERAWVFVLLARQEGLDAVVLGLADPAENTPIARGIRPMRPWCVAVLIDDRAYLFDPLLGLPIPAKDGIRHDAQGRLDIQPADLAEIVADGSLLRKLDLNAEQTYPVTAEDLQNVVALVEASPSSLSYRMKLIESRLVGKQKMVLTTSADEQARRWQSLPQISKARLWTLPYETIARRSRLSSRKICRHLAEFLPFYALPNAPLSTGRLTHLEGRFVGQRGAIGFYQTSRPSREELQYLAISSTSEDLDKVQQDLRKLKKDIVKANNAPPSDNTSSSPFLHQRKQDVEERIAAIDLAKLGEKIQNEYVKAVLKKLTIQTEEERKKLVAKLKEAALRLLAGSIFSGKQDATYWLGLISFQRGNYEAATDYFLKRTLEKHPHGLWSHGARYNLAYSIERSGQIERAALIFQSDPSAPDVYGRLLRARWLTEKTGQ